MLRSTLRSLLPIFALGLAACGDALPDAGDVDENGDPVAAAEEALAPGMNLGGGVLPGALEGEISPSEAPVCPDCERNGTLRLNLDAQGLVSSVSGTYLTARTPLAAKGVLVTADINDDRLLVFPSVTATAPILDVPVGSFTVGKWIESTGVGFVADVTSTLALTAAQRSPANWGYRDASNGYVAYIALKNPKYAGGRLLLPVPVQKYVNGAWTVVRQP